MLAAGASSRSRQRNQQRSPPALSETAHLHDQWYLPTTPHIKATVEQRDHRPATLLEVVALAKELAAGTMPRGRRTRTQIDAACARERQTWD